MAQLIILPEMDSPSNSPQAGGDEQEAKRQAAGWDKPSPKHEDGHTRATADQPHHGAILTPQERGKSATPSCSTHPGPTARGWPARIPGAKA